MLAKCSRASCTSISSTSLILLPLNRACSVSRLNRRPSHTGQVTQTSARKSISRRFEPLPSQASQRPPGLLNLKRSEERRVGKECRSGGAEEDEKEERMWRAGSGVARAASE